MIQKNEKQEKLLHVESLYSVKKVRLLTQHTMLLCYIIINLGDLTFI